MKKNESSKKIYTKKHMIRVNNKINLLGVSSKLNTMTFLNTQLITTIIIFVFVLINYKYGYIFSIIISAIYYYLFEKILLDKKIKQREKRLNIDAIYFFEVLTLSLQTGRNLSEAISITTNSVDNDLSLEFKEALRETRFGKSL